MIIYWPSGDVCLFLEQCQINPCFVWFFCPLKTSFTSCPTPLLNVTAKCSWRRQGNAYGEKQVDQGQNSLICYYHIDFSSSFFFISLLLSSSPFTCLSPAQGFIWSAVNSSSQWATVGSSCWELLKALWLRTNLGLGIHLRLKWLPWQCPL